MTGLESVPFQIRDIIRNNRIETHFQPILSARKKSVVGLEALSRGVDAERGLIPPKILFELANQQNLSLEFDRLCRDNALRRFREVCYDESLLLFLNLSTSVLDFGITGPDYLVEKINELGLSPENIAIEMLESEVTDTENLKRFVNACREHGFLIALDDVGIGYSNLDRILLVKPDILKIDRGLVQNIDGDYYKQELFKSLVVLAQKIGALVVAEGVETQEEALVCYDYGVDFFQGFYFAKPQTADSLMMEQPRSKVHEVAQAYRQSRIEKINLQSRKRKQYNQVLRRILVELQYVPAYSFEQKLRQIIKDHPMLEYLYILNSQGVQVTESICNSRVGCRGSRIFQAARKGADQSLKDYCLFIEAGAREYVTEPYMSLATGKPCVTCAKVFQDIENQTYILCADFNP